MTEVRSPLIATVDTEHQSLIHDAQMDFYGKKLATCSSDCTIKIFEFDEETNSSKSLDTLNGHTGPVWQAAWAHPKFGTFLASASYDKRVIIWQEHNGHWASVYKYPHSSSVNSVIWAPHELGLVLAAGSSDGSISIHTCSSTSDWDVQKIDNAHESGCNAVSWAPAVDPDSLVENSTGRRTVSKIVSGGCDNIVRIWECIDGKWEASGTLTGHNDWVRDVAWAPFTGLPVNTIASCSQDGQVIIWSRDPTRNQEEWQFKVLKHFPDVIWHVSWSLTGNILAVSGGDNEISLWKEVSNGSWRCISNINKEHVPQDSPLIHGDIPNHVGMGLYPA